MTISIAKIKWQFENLKIKVKIKYKVVICNLKIEI